jgi:hypothetical protein
MKARTRPPQRARCAPYDGLPAPAMMPATFHNHLIYLIFS